MQNTLNRNYMERSKLDTEEEMIDDNVAINTLESKHSEKKRFKVPMHYGILLSGVRYM